MTTFKEQLVADMADVFMNTDEFAVSAKLIHKNGRSEDCTCSIDILGQEQGEWSGGLVTVSNVLMEKAGVVESPEAHSVIEAEGEKWTIDCMISEDDCSWQLKAFKGYKPK